MAYTMIHTAEQIDYKLNLINENKNLLPYNDDYKTALLDNGLEDVGDGSILVTKDFTNYNTYIQLSTCSLPAGKRYIFSLNVTDLIADSGVSDQKIQLKATFETSEDIVFSNIDLIGSNTFKELDLSAATQPVSAVISLIITQDFIENSLIKPQIEEAKEGQTAPSNWVPYMDKIGSYIDERFNSTNAKIKVINDRLSSVDNGLANKVAAALTIHRNESNPHNITAETVGLNNVDNKSVATIKSEFTGSVAENNTGFITGGAAYSAINAHCADRHPNGNIKIGETELAQGQLDKILSFMSLVEIM